MIDSTTQAARYHAVPSPGPNQPGKHRVDLDGLSTISAPISVPPGSKWTWTYFLLGCAIFLPYNALTLSTSFFLSQLIGSTFHVTYSSYSSSVYTCTRLGTQFYSTFTMKQSSSTRRIFGSIIGMILIVACLGFSTFCRSTPACFFAFAMLAAAAMALTTSYLCTSVYAGAALLGPSYLQAVLLGEAAIAVAISIVQVISSMVAVWGLSRKSISGMGTVAGGRGPEEGHAEALAARIFFGVSALFLWITLASFVLLRRQPFYKSLTNTLEKHRSAGIVEERTALLTHSDRDPTATSELGSNMYQVFRKNFIFMFSIACVFIVNLSISPSITAQVRPVNPNFHPLLFTSVHFSVINIAALLGQYSCSIPCLRVWSGKKILVMSLLQTVYIPLVLLCNVERSPTAVIPVLIHSDIIFMIIIFGLGYMYGYLVAQIMLAASSLVHNPRLEGRREDVDVAATLCASCMSLGLALGSLSSFAVLTLI